MIAPESAVRACDPRRPALYAAARTVSGSASGLLALSRNSMAMKTISLSLIFPDRDLELVWFVGLVQRHSLPPDDFPHNTESFRLLANRPGKRPVTSGRS
jgi:hypothetical protein